MDVASKNLDNNDRYSYEGQSEDMHTWFFLYDEKLVSKSELEPMKQVTMIRNHAFFHPDLFQMQNKDLCSSTSVPNLDMKQSKDHES